MKSKNKTALMAAVGGMLVFGVGTGWGMMLGDARGDARVEQCQAAIQTLGDAGQETAVALRNYHSMFNEVLTYGVSVNTEPQIINVTKHVQRSNELLASVEECE